MTLVELPLVLPPAVAGIGLLAAFGAPGACSARRSTALGLELAFTQIAVVLAVTFVASPFYVRQAIAAFEAVDDALLDASRTLGAGPGATSPASRCRSPRRPRRRSALAFARGIGEFGATIMFAGSLQGVTQTLSLAIYEQFDVDFDVALAISALLVVVSGALLLAVKLVPGWTSLVSTSPSRSAPSASS